MTTEIDAVRRDLATLNKAVAELQREVQDLRHSLLGDYDKPGGHIIRIAENTRGYHRLRETSHDHKKRLEELEKWQNMITNRAMGIAIGMSLSSAIGGGTVVALIGQFFGG